jgi:hypothetical protein
MRAVARYLSKIFDGERPRPHGDMTAEAQARGHDEWFMPS